MSWDVALPLHLTSFEAKSDQGRGRLSWTTSWEENSAHFLIQKTYDFKQIQTVGKITSAGNFRIGTSYEWFDEVPLEATTYYRLIQVDYDGASTTFNWAAIGNPDKMIALYPNTIVDGFYVTSALKVANVVLTDLSGRHLRSFNSQPFSMDWKI